MLSLENVAEVEYQVIKRKLQFIALSFVEKIKFDYVIKNNNLYTVFK